MTPDWAAFLKEFEGKRLGVAVSGGGDSMALLALLAARGVEVVTVDHGLRAEAADEAALVAAFCAAKGLSHEVLRWDWDGAGNLQAEARAARYALMAEWAKARRLDAVCLAHTRDDQAETVLMRLARKAGSEGLRGMPARFERGGVLWLRPLLGVSREELRGVLRREGVAWAEDPSNDDMRFERVKARRALAALGPLGIDAGVLADVAGQLAKESDALRASLAALVEAHLCCDYGAVRLPLEVFAGLHGEFKRRFLAQAVQWVSGAEYPERAVNLEAMAAGLAEGETLTLGGVIGFSAKGLLWLCRELKHETAARDWAVTGAEGEIRALGDGGLRQRPDWRESGLPRRLALVLPGVWEGETLKHAPHLDKSGEVQADFLRQKFTLGPKGH